MTIEKTVTKIQSLVGEACTLSEELETQFPGNEAEVLVAFLAMANGGVLSCSTIFMRAAVEACRPLMQEFIDGVEGPEEVPN